MHQNVAPEFGVEETKKLLELMNYYKPKLKVQKFIELTVQSGNGKNGC